MCEHDRNRFDQGPRQGPYNHRDDFRDREPDWQRGGPPPRDFDQDRHDDPFSFERHFISRAEMVEGLEGYLEDLENEAQGVREFLAELNAETIEPEVPIAQPRPSRKRAPAKAK